MGPNKFDRLLLLLIHVSEFAELLVFVPLFHAVPGSQIVRSPIVRLAFRSHPQHDSDVVAERNKAMEDFIIADEPRRHDRDERDGGNDIERKPAFAATMTSIDDPRGEKRQHGEHGRTGQRA